MKRFSQYWKAAIAVLGALLVLLNTLVGENIFGADTQKWLNVAIAAVTAVLVFMKANTTLIEGMKPGSPPGTL